MRKGVLLVLVPALLAGEPVDPELPAYDAKEREPGGTIRFGLALAGAPRRLVERWKDEFRRLHPNVRIEIAASGALPDSPEQIIAASEPLPEREARAFRTRRGHDVVEFRVGYEQVALVVHASNPLRHVSLDELDAAWSATRNRGAERAANTWGDLGLEGGWANRPIRFVASAWSDSPSELVRRVALESGAFRKSVAERGDDRAVVHAVARDPGAFGFAYPARVIDGVRILPIRGAHGEVARPSEAAARAGTYPLSRPVWIRCAADWRKGLDPAIRAFLRFASSREGQEALAGAGFVPVRAATASAHRRNLDVALDPDRLRGPVVLVCEPGDREAAQALLTHFRGQHPDATLDVDCATLHARLPQFLEGPERVVFTRRVLPPAAIREFGREMGFTPTYAPAGYASLAVIVHRDNPLEHITVPQLDAIWSVERRRKAPRTIASWGELGLEDEWANRRVLPFLCREDPARERFREFVLKYGPFRESAWEPGEDEPVESIVAKEPGAIGLAPLATVTPRVRALPIRLVDGTVVAPSRETITSGRYPLATEAFFVFVRDPGKPLPPARAAFLRYLYSPAGRRMVSGLGLEPVTGELAKDTLHALGLEPK